MTIEEILEQRCIREVLHFTTHFGTLGILKTKYVKSRKRLPEDEWLEYILKNNAARRLDTGWLDYVNLSVSRINTSFYNFSSGQHPDVWWAILSFDPVILTHEGVYFVTANNIWPKAIRRSGSRGLEALFAPRVIGRYDEVITRGTAVLDCCPTCIQAEVLYPGQLSTDYLRKIYVITGEDQDDVYGQISALRHREILVEVNPVAFGRNTE